MRRAERVPGVVYGLDKPPFLVSVSPRRLREILTLESGRNTIFTLKLVGEDKTRAAMIKELQRDPVSEDVLHVDFIRLDLERRLTVSVPVLSLQITDVYADVEIDDGSGSISISGVASVVIDDGSGSITVTDASGDVEIEDGSGSITIEKVGGGVRIDDGSGGIDVSDVELDLVIVDDGSGDLDTSDVRGGVINESAQK